MRSSRYFIAVGVVGLVATLSLLFWGNVLAQDKGKGVAASSVQWEYKVIRARVTGQDILLKQLEDSLNDLGKDGWECVGTVSETEGGGKASNRTNAVMICKRAKK